MNYGHKVDQIKGEILEVAKSIARPEIRLSEAPPCKHFSRTKSCSDASTNSGQLQLLERLREILFLRWLLDRIGHGDTENEVVQDAWTALIAVESQCAFYPLHVNPACFPKERMSRYNDDLPVILETAEDGIRAACRTIAGSLAEDLTSSGPHEPVAETSEDPEERHFTRTSNLLWQGNAIQAIPMVPCDRKRRLDQRLMRSCRDGHIDGVRVLLDIMGDQDSFDHLLSSNDNAFDAAHGKEIPHLLLDTVMKKFLDGENVEKVMDRAIEFGSRVHVKELLARGASVEGAEDGMWSRLVDALEKGHLEVARCLIQAGADVNALGICDITPLMLACGRGDLAAVNLLLDHGANSHYPTRDTEGCDILTYACIGGNPEIVKLLLEQESCGFLLDTAVLNKAIEREHWGVLQVLLEHGEGQSYHYCREESPLSVAVNSGNQSLIRLFMEKYTLSLKNKPQTELTWAAQNGDLGVIRLLMREGFDVNRSDKFDRTPLMAASHEGRLEVVRELVNSGADANRVNRDGDTALILALQYGHFETAKFLLETSDAPPWESLLLQAVRQGNHAALKFLMKNGAQPNHPLGGCYPLLMASSRGDLGAVDLLINHGADLDFSGRGFPTSLKLAATLGNFKLVKLLLWRGAGIDTRLPPSCYVVPVQERLYGELAEPLHLGPGDHNPLRSLNWTPLMGAAAMGHDTTVGLLVKHGADVNLCDGEGRTPLMISAKRGHVGVVKALVDGGANVNAAAKEGKSALDYAVENRHSEVAMMLREHGASR